MSSEQFHDTGSSPGLSVLVEPHDEAVVLTVAGEVDLTTAPRLSETIKEAMAGEPETLVVDLSGVGFLASAGMAVLIGCHQQAKGNIRFRIVATGSATFRPMELTGMTDEMSIFPTREEALAAD